MIMTFAIIHIGDISDILDILDILDISYNILDI